LKGLATGEIPYYYGYMIRQIVENKIQHGTSVCNLIEERSFQWDALPLFFVLCKENAVVVIRGECGYW
jgi:hypothetical protein